MYTYMYMYIHVSAHQCQEQINLPSYGSPLMIKSLVNIVRGQLPTHVQAKSAGVAKPRRP